jgi:ubiquinone/menaquinone biosynthesis C-methylase UbiE
MNNDFDTRQDAYWAQTSNIRPYDHPVVRLFAQQRVEFIASILKGWRPITALDVGCGDGFGMHYMDAIVETVHGCDKSQTMLDANPASSMNLTRCDAYDLPWPDSSFDLVYCWELLHHLSEPGRAVSEMTRVAIQTVLVCEPNCFNPAMALFGLLKTEERGLLRSHPFSMSRLLKDVGLKRIESHSVGYFTPNRTPETLARMFTHLPYQVPLVGMYTITLGHRQA